MDPSSRCAIVDVSGEGVVLKVVVSSCRDTVRVWSRNGFGREMEPQLVAAASGPRPKELEVGLVARLGGVQGGLSSTQIRKPLESTGHAWTDRHLRWL